MRQTILVAIFVLMFSALGFGQARFADSAVGEGKTDEAMQKCGALPIAPPLDFYHPPQTSLVKVGQTHVVNKNHYACMWTGARYQWKAEPAGSTYHILTDGDWSFEGNVTYKIRACHNRVLAVFYAEEVAVPVVTYTPSPTPTLTLAPTPLPCVSTPYSGRREQINGKWATVSMDKDCNKVVIFDAELACPVVTDASYGTKGWGARMPSWQEWLMGPGKAAAIAAVASNGDDRWKSVLLSAGVSSVDTLAVNLLFPDLNVINLQTTAGAMTVQKGKSAFTVQTAEFGILTLDWPKKGLITLRSPKGVCFAGSVQKGFQTASDVFIYRDQHKVSHTVPIKTQTQTQIPIGIGGINGGGCVPGANNCPIITSVPNLPSAQNPNGTLNQGGVPIHPYAAMQNGNTLVNAATGPLPSQQLFQPKPTNCPADTVPYQLQNGATGCAALK